MSQLVDKPVLPNSERLRLESATYLTRMRKDRPNLDHWIQWVRRPPDATQTFGVLDELPHEILGVDIRNWMFGPSKATAGLGVPSKK